MKNLRHLRRFLVTLPRAIVVSEWLPEQQYLHSFSDSDFAGGRGIAKFTSDGMIMLCRYYITSWSYMQKNVAVSSGEAERAAIVKCGCDTIGIL